MRPLRITIQADAWDSQVYRGLLYIWYMDGSLGIYRWDDLILSLSRRPEDDLALTCAFLRGDYLYADVLIPFMGDKEIISTLLHKFDTINSYDITITKDHLEKNQQAFVDSPFGDLCLDIEMYNKMIYATTNQGLFGTMLERGKEKSPRTKTAKLWDASPLAIEAKSNLLCMSVGNDGLFELDLDAAENSIRQATRHTKTVPADRFKHIGLERVDRGIYQISHKPSNSSSWTNTSIFSSNDQGDSYLAGFNWGDQMRTGSLPRYFIGSIDEQTMFGTESNGYSFGNANRLCRVNGSRIEIVGFTQRRLTDEGTHPQYALVDSHSTGADAFKRLAIHELKRSDPSNNYIHSGGIFTFGTVIEYNDYLLIAHSNGEDETTTSYAPARWRAFPRSRQYENQLHVIGEDFIEIFAFVDDYLQDQDKKAIAISFGLRNTEIITPFVFTSRHEYITRSSGEEISDSPF